MMRSTCATAVIAVAVALSLLACGQAAPPPGAAASSADQARQFLANVNDTMTRLWIAVNQSGWVAQTYITDDTEAIDARTSQEVIAAQAKFAKEATAFAAVEVSDADRAWLEEQTKGQPVGW